MPAKTQFHVATSVYAGTSGWAYASWKPGFYPGNVPGTRFLEHYATRLNSVEVNYTFGKLPSDAMVSSWLAATPETFRFSFKAPQRITHFSRLRDCGTHLADFFASIAAVGKAGRMGAVLFQLPPNFKADAVRLSAFLGEAAMRGVARAAFEFRHASWLSEEVFETLRDHGAALCIAESDALKTPQVQTGGFAYYRLRKSIYTTVEVAALAATFASQSAGRDVYAYFKHGDAPDGPLRAEALLRTTLGLFGEEA